MEVGAKDGLLRFFDEIEDPRMERTQLHSLNDILFITISAVLCGADNWVEVEMYGQSKHDWLRTFLPLPNGIPSHDTFSRVFARLDPEQLEQGFQKWMAALATASQGRLIAIDGKTLRRSCDKANKKLPIHMVSAWSETNHLVLGQLATEEKSNEITAIPALLKMLELEQSVVTIDAMGCQKTIAKQIVQGGGDYLLAVKKNHSTLHARIQETFEELTTTGIGGVEYTFHEEVDAGHGRVETRRLWATEWIDWYSDAKNWANLRTIVCVERSRELEGETNSERHYYISSLPSHDAEALAGYVRGHWGIENRLHWSLDIAFREDDSRMRAGHSAENFSRIRRLALNLLAREKTCKVGKKAKRLRAALDNNYTLKLLSQGI